MHTITFLANRSHTLARFAAELAAIGLPSLGFEARLTLTAPCPRRLRDTMPESLAGVDARDGGGLGVVGRIEVEGPGREPERRDPHRAAGAASDPPPPSDGSLRVPDLFVFVSDHRTDRPDGSCIITRSLHVRFDRFVHTLPRLVWDRDAVAPSLLLPAFTAAETSSVSLGCPLVRARTVSNVLATTIMDRIERHPGQPRQRQPRSLRTAEREVTGAQPIGPPARRRPARVAPAETAPFRRGPAAPVVAARVRPAGKDSL